MMYLNVLNGNADPFLYLTQGIDKIRLRNILFPNQPRTHMSSATSSNRWSKHNPKNYFMSYFFPFLEIRMGSFLFPPWGPMTSLREELHADATFGRQLLAPSSPTRRGEILLREAPAIWLPWQITSDERQGKKKILTNSWGKFL